jgi:hypothetical protein
MNRLLRGLVVLEVLKNDPKTPARDVVTQEDEIQYAAARVREKALRVAMSQLGQKGLS